MQEHLVKFSKVTQNHADTVKELARMASAHPDTFIEKRPNIGAPSLEQQKYLQDMVFIATLIGNGKIINAIKEARTIFGLDLLGAKNIVELIRDCGEKGKRAQVNELH